MVGDVDGDKAAELVTVDDEGRTYVHHWNGTGFDPESFWGAIFCKPTSASIGVLTITGATPLCRLADVDGDWRADLVAQLPQDQHHHLRRVQIAISNGSEFAFDVTNYHELDCRNPSGCLLGDVDADGLGDVIDPVSSFTENDPANGRTPGYVWVSYGTDHPNGPVWTDYISGYDPTPIGAVCSANQPQGAQVTTFAVKKVVGPQSESFAVATTDKAYRHLGGESWTKTSNAAIEYEATQVDLFKLLSDGTVARRKADLGWGGKGGGFTDIFAGWGGLFGTRSDGRLLAHDCYCGNVQRTGWYDIGEIGREVAVGGIAGSNGDDTLVQPQLYKRYGDGEQDGVWKFYFPGESWLKIGGPADRIYAGADKLYATSPDSGDLWAYDAYDGTWSPVSAPNHSYAVSQVTGSIAALTLAKDKILLRRVNTNYWQTLGGSADQIWFVNGSIWATEPGTGFLFRIPVE
jgi:hypothetical protein